MALSFTCGETKMSQNIMKMIVDLSAPNNFLTCSSSPNQHFVVKNKKNNSRSKWRVESNANFHKYISEEIG